MTGSIPPSSTASLDLSGDVERALLPTPPDVRDEVLQIFDACAPAVHRYVRSCGIESDAADDIVQETFVALFQHLRKGGRTENLRGWVMQVGYRLALKHRRNEGRKGRWLGAWKSEAATVSDPAAGPEDACVDRENGQRLRSVLRALPRRDRQCLYLRAEGLRYREIAEVLGVSLGAVAKSVTRAVARLSAVVDR